MHEHPNERTARSEKSKSRSLSRALAWILCGAMATFAVAAQSSCSVIVDGSPDSCSADSDCINLPGRSKCDTAEGVCISADECQASSECDANSYCTPVTPRICAQLANRTGSCSILFSGKSESDPNEGAFKTEGALVIGVTAPLTGADESTGASISNGARLAVEELNKSDQFQVPIVLLICDDEGERTIAEENGRTLASLGVQAIIGPAFSGQTLDTANGTVDSDGTKRPGTIANNVLIISSSATSPAVTGIADASPRCIEKCDSNPCEEACPGLVWRTSPSDLIQGKASATYFAELEPIVKSRGGEDPPRPTIKVAALYKPDSYGQELEKAVKANLVFNGMAAFQQPNDYYSKEYQDVEPLAAEDFDEVLAFEPDVIFLMGTGEIGAIISEIEGRLTVPAADRPYYVLPDGGISNGTTNATASLKERVRGTVPGTSNDNFGIFKSSYQGRFEDDGATVFGGAGAYDIVYMLAYSASLVSGQPTSEDLARGLRQLADPEGEVIAVGSTNFGSGLSELQSAKGIDFDGASGPLDFDEQDEAASDIQVWCQPPSGNGVKAGFFYSAEDEAMDGTPDPGEEFFSCPF